MARASSVMSKYDCAVLTVCSDVVLLRHHESDGDAERCRLEPWRNNGSARFEGENINSSMCKPVTYSEIPSKYYKPRSR